MGQPLQDPRRGDHVEEVTTWQAIGISQDKRQPWKITMRPTCLREKPKMDV